MKASTLVRVGTLVLISTLVAACATTPTLSKAGPGALFKQPVAQVQKAAVEALAEDGFDMTEQQATYVEGKRPHKIGLFVGSGGETVGVWLTASGGNATEVKVDTTKSSLGYLGQKNWNDQILEKMRRILKD